MSSPSVMTQAFLAARVGPSLPVDSPLVDRVVSSMERHIKGLGKAHKNMHLSKGWTTNLSYKTYRQLVNKGVLSA